MFVASDVLYTPDAPIRADLAIVGDPRVSDGSTFTFVDGDDTWYAMPSDFALAGSMDDEPVSYDDAMSGPNAREWRGAWEKEIGRLEAARTWELVYPPPN